MRRLAYGLVAGCVFAFLTLMMIEFPVLSPITSVARFQRVFSVILMPGFFIGYVASGNIHVASSWVVISANFAFYTGFVYLSQLVWSNLRPTSRSGSDEHARLRSAC